MTQEIVKGSTEPLVFGALIASSDHRTRLTLATFTTLAVSAGGASFTAVDPSDVVEVGLGEYAIPASVLGNYPTVGPLLVHAEATGADPFDQRFEVIPLAGVPPLFQGSTTYPLTFLLVSSSDHLTGVTSLPFGLSTQLSKAGGPFGHAAGIPTHIGFGNWCLAGNAANYDTEGPLILALSPIGIGFDPVNYTFDVAPNPTPSPGDDLMAAMIAQLRATPAVVAAFGEDTSATATTKFHADQALGATMPYAVYEEIEEGRQPTSPDDSGVVNYFCRGRVRFLVVASKKKVARTLGDLLIATLNDAPLTFDDGTLLELRAQTPAWHTNRDEATGAPVSFIRIVTFLYMVQRTF